MVLPGPPGKSWEDFSESIAKSKAEPSIKSFQNPQDNFEVLVINRLEPSVGAVMA
jgi:hypothetical protein